MSTKKSVRSSKNTDQYKKVEKAEAELKKRINEDYPEVHRRLFRWILSLGWLGVGSIIVTGLVTWSFVSYLSISITVKLLLVSITCYVVGILGSKNTKRREKMFKSPQKSFQESAPLSNSPKGSYLYIKNESGRIYAI
ncbi:hypothetical protein UH38_21840 [Aliterella atlantica CENA595]|uniref:Uncharacterized protein n=2 Tax=Aliterella TaxID=1827277 RepID=A0A0D8ZMU9_9CYAN|nr:hypothetical protein UH38_21840 [Aliterella atlantica CENA595]